MKLLAAGLSLAVAFGSGCTSSRGGSGLVVPPPVVDGGNTGDDAGPGVDAGPGADAGAPDSGSPDAGSPDAGSPDAGPADAGPADAGPTFGGPGPWPMQNVTYGLNDGIQETPVVGMSTDETQNLWVATKAAVYLMRPGDKKFTRYDVQSGLHMAGRNTTYCDSSYTLDAEGRAAGLPEPDKACPIFGAADVSGITEIVGGGPNEVFVGYNGTHNWDDPNDGTWADPLRHTGMLDRVKLNPTKARPELPESLAIQVDRLQMIAGNSPAFWHNRDVMRLVYDHFKHPHNLYVGTNHGIDKMTPDGFVPITPSRDGEVTYPDKTYSWMSDHLHPQVCSCGPCPIGGGEGPLLLGDWRGLAVTANGNLLVGGRWAAGKIIWTAANHTDDGLGWFQRAGHSYEFTMGDGYGGGCTGGRPVFCVNREGDVVAISAVTETPDGLQWFASGPYGSQPDRFCSDQKAFPGQKNTGDRDLGVASFVPDGMPLPPGRSDRFAYYNPISDLGMAETNVRDMVALPDGRIVFATPNHGLFLWNPKTNTKTSVPMSASSGHLRDDQVQRLELDLMVSPPVLHVSTNSGATSIRVFPQ